MDSLVHSMRWDEETFGLELDLDRFMIVAVADFNMGAMENKGLNIFNTKFILAKPDTATDLDYENVESVVAHEYFHNWTGNRVTCRDWFQLTLKEGLTVFRDQQFSADMLARAAGPEGAASARAVKRIDDVRVLRAAQFPEDGGPMAHPIRPDSYQEINNFYTATVYEKGAEVIRMLHTLLGQEGFRNGMDLYFSYFDGQAVTCDDFVEVHVRGNNGFDLDQFMRWYEQAGTPRVKASGVWNAASGSYTLTLAQSTPATPGQHVKQPLVIPVAVGLIGADGRDLPLQLEGESAGGATPPACSKLTEEPHLPLRRPRRRAGALAAARLLRAGDPGARRGRRAPGLPHGARRRPLQPLGRRAALRRARRAGARRRPRGDGAGGLRRRLPHLLNDARSTPPSAPRRSRCRARPTCSSACRPPTPPRCAARWCA
jgi:aminopeptidase N